MSLDQINRPFLEIQFPKGWTQLQPSGLYYNQTTDMVCEGPVFNLKDLQRVLQFEGIQFDKELMIRQIKSLGQQEKLNVVSQAITAPNLSINPAKSNQHKKGKGVRVLPPLMNYFTNDVPSEISLATDPISIMGELSKRSFKLLLSIDLILKEDQGNKFLIKIGNSNYAEYQVAGDHKVGKKKVALKLLSQIAPNVFSQVCKKQSLNENYISQVKINKIYARQNSEKKKQKQTVMLERFQDDVQEDLLVDKSNEVEEEEKQRKQQIPVLEKYLDTGGSAPLQKNQLQENAYKIHEIEQTKKKNSAGNNNIFNQFISLDDQTNQVKLRSVMNMYQQKCGKKEGDLNSIISQDYEISGQYMQQGRDNVYYDEQVQQISF